jgi:hypothetical protein
MYGLKEAGKLSNLRLVSLLQSFDFHQTLTPASSRIATNERQIIHDTGHLQPPTPIFCDTEVAIGLTNGSVTLKISKSLDMRFHWLRDRLRQGQ